MALVDHNRRVIVMLAGRPSDPDWDNVIAEATAMLLASGEAYNERGEDISHRRGRYVVYACGVLYGGGQRVVTI